MSSQTENLQLGAMAMIYKMQLSTKRMHEMMVLDREVTAKQLQLQMGCSQTSVHMYAAELVKHGLWEKTIIMPNGYKKAIYKKISEAEYVTMDFNAKSTKINNARKRIPDMPDLPSYLLSMMGYTNFNPPAGRYVTEGLPSWTGSRTHFSQVGSSLEVVA